MTTPDDPFDPLEDDHPPAEPGELAGLRVLVVANDPVDHRMLQGGLDFLGCESSTVSSADQAMELLSQNPHQVVLADVSLPGMGGSGTVASLRRAARAAAPSRGSRLTVVAVSDWDSEDTADSYLSSGFDDHLLRPMELGSLTALLRRWAPRAHAPRARGTTAGDEEAGREIVRELELSAQEEARVELHTFLNILNLVSGQLQLLRMHLGGEPALQETLEVVGETLEAVGEGVLDPSLLDRLSTVETSLRTEAEEALTRAREGEVDRDAAREALGNLESILEVLATRIEEYSSRSGRGFQWRDHSTARLREDLGHFLDAVERNARERYRIVRDAPSQEPGDYVVGLTVEGPEGDTLRMPPVLADVLRDLVANARKYTPPGGALSAELTSDGDELRLVVEDSGVGIPADEVERVVELGYRASNVRDRDSWGGGFGLTKAYRVTRRLGGRFWIDSEPGRGTRVTLRIPVPSEP